MVRNHTYIILIYTHNKYSFKKIEIQYENR